MTDPIQGPWTVSHALRPNFEKPTDAGLFEIEEANVLINDLLAQGRHAEAFEAGERYRRAIETLPELLRVCESALVALDLAEQDRFDEGRQCRWLREVIAKVKGGAAC